MSVVGAAVARRAVRAAIPVAILAAAWVRAVPAALPDATMSYADPVIVGSSSGAAPGDSFLVIVRTVGGSPKWHAYVTLIFAGTGMRLYQQQEAPDSVDCAAKVLALWSNVNGVALFHPRLGGFENGSVIQVRANGVLLKSVPARSTDLNGDGQTDLPDVEAFRVNFLTNRSAPETDYDRDGTTTLRDLAILRAEFFSGARGSVCP